MNKIKEDIIKKATELHNMNIERLEDLRTSINMPKNDKSIQLLRQKENDNYKRFIEDVKRYNFLWNGIKDTELGTFYKVDYFKVSTGDILVIIYSSCCDDLDIFDWKLEEEYGGLEQDYYKCQRVLITSVNIWWDLVYDAWNKAREHDWLILERKNKKK